MVTVRGYVGVRAAPLTRIKRQHRHVLIGLRKAPSLKINQKAMILKIHMRLPCCHSQDHHLGASRPRRGTRLLTQLELSTIPKCFCHNLNGA